MNLEEERILTEKAQMGDREALGLLWDEITPKLLGYLINSTHNRTISEDLLQATWLKAIKALPNFEQRGVRTSAWLFAIARNECRQYWRNSKREIVFDPLLHDQPSHEYQQTEDTIFVEQVLNKMSEDDRELIRLRYIADLAVTEISQVLGINSVTVRVRLHRALHKARLIISNN